VVSSCFRAYVAACFASLSGVVFTLCLHGCGREEIELFPVTPAPAPTDAGSLQPTGGSPGSTDAGTPGPAGECGAAVPEALLAPRPPMGWNGYNHFGSDPELDEEKFKSMVEALVGSGMHAAGYQYVNLDIGWQVTRTTEGERAFEPLRLPGGIQALSDWVHARGLSFGIYSHIQDCFEMAGGEGFEAMDVASYVAWGVDYLKYVNCFGANEEPRQPVEALAAALADAERPIVLSLAAAPFQEWMAGLAQVWRVSSDAQPTWSSIVDAIDTVLPLAPYTRPGAFNDPDMLQIGNGSLTEAEQRVQFSVWSILSAPLLAGNDLTLMTEPVRAILTNSEVIALNQDPLGLQATRVHTEGDVEILAKPLAQCGERAVVLWNRGTTSAEVFVAWEDLWLEPQVATVWELWNDVRLEVDSAGFSVEVAGHDAVALRVEGDELPLPRGTVQLGDLRWTYATNGYGPVELDQTNGETEPLDGAPIRLRGVAYDKGLGVHGPSLIRYRLGRACSRFSADVGIDDDQAGLGSAQFEVWADAERLFQSAVLTGESPSVRVDVDVSGRLDLRLFVGIGGDDFAHDHAVWAGALLECEP
jgi:alpha-galactosidase